MFCKNCGTQMADNAESCSNCGSIVNTKSEEHKKKSKGLFIGLMVGIVGILVAVFCIIAFVTPGFLKNESTAKQTSSESEKSTESAEAETLYVDLDEVEALAVSYNESISKSDVVNICETEIVSWGIMEYVYEDVIVDLFEAQSGYRFTIDEIYEGLSDEANYPINNMADLFKVVFAQEQFEDAFTDIKVHSSEVISKKDADKYIEKTKNKMDELKDYGLNSNYYDWDEIESYAKVDGEVTKNDKTKEKFFMIFGYLNGEWLVLYDSGIGEENDGCLSTLGGLLNMIESIENIKNGTESLYD